MRRSRRGQSGRAPWRFRSPPSSRRCRHERRCECLDPHDWASLRPACMTVALARHPRVVEPEPTGTTDPVDGYWEMASVRHGWRIRWRHRAGGKRSRSVTGKCANCDSFLAPPGAPQVVLHLPGPPAFGATARGLILPACQRLRSYRRLAANPATRMFLAALESLP